MAKYLVQMTHMSGVPVVKNMTERQARQLDNLMDECHVPGSASARGRGFVIKLPIVPEYVGRAMREKGYGRKELEDLLIPLMPGGNTLAAYDAVVDYFYNKIFS